MCIRDRYGDFLKKLAKDIGALAIDFSHAFPLENAWYYDCLLYTSRCV